MPSDSDREPVAARGRLGTLAVFAGVSCFFALVQVGTIFSGLVHLPFSRSLAVVMLSASLAVSILFATRFLEFARADAARTAPAPSRWGERLLNASEWLLGLGAVLWAAWVWVELWVLAWLRPPYDWDGLFYHIPAIHEWVVAGRVSWIGNSPDVPYVNFPMGVELTTFVTHYLVGTSRLLNACNLPYWALAFLSLVVIAKRVGARGAWPWVAGALIVGAPVFVSQSASCYIDPGFVGTVMAALAATLVFVFDTDRSVWWRAVLMGACLGLCLGAKGTGLPFSVVFVAAASAGVFWVRNTGPWKRSLGGLGVVVLVVLLVGGYWYVRNTVVAGNPAYPMAINVGEKIVVDGADHAELLEGNVPTWLKDYPGALRVFVSWLQRDAPISGFDPTGGMGYVWIAGAVPAILFLWVLAARRRYPGPVREFAFLTVLILCLFAVQPAQWWARFTVWLHALGLPSIAVAAGNARARWRESRWHIVTLALAVAMVAVAVWESGRTLDIEWSTGRLAGTGGLRARYETSLEHVFPGMAESPGFEEFLAARTIARSAWGHHGTRLGGILSMPLGRRKIRFLAAGAGGTDVDRLLGFGVEWVVWDVQGAGDPPEQIGRAAQRHYEYHPAYDLHFHLFFLQPD